MTPKYRAWNGKEMLTDGELLIIGDQWWYGESDYETPPIGAYSGNEGNVLMQFTELHDKAGIPIFEGDLVKIVPDEKQTVANKPHYEGLLFGDIAQVKWNETNMRWSLFPLDENLEETNMDYYGAWSGWNWLEVIGSIHTSPELLTK